jgi:hypothetical protein
MAGATGFEKCFFAGTGKFKIGNCPPAPDEKRVYAKTLNRGFWE